VIGEGIGLIGFGNAKHKESRADNMQIRVTHLENPFILQVNVNGSEGRRRSRWSNFSG